MGIRSYLSGAETNHQVSNEGVLCLSRAMADHHTPAITLGQLAAERHRHMQALLISLHTSRTGLFIYLL